HSHRRYPRLSPRLAALAGDKMMAMPVFCVVGAESWKAKEAKASEEELPQWGASRERGIQWETMTATLLLQAGADILLMRHPKAVEAVRAMLKDLSAAKA
ncbi:MAG: hypothetical protein WCL50_13955, partial [Spirochaetota bacterium]